MTSGDQPPQLAPTVDTGGGSLGEDLGRRAGSALLWGQLAKVAEIALTTAFGVLALRALQPTRFGTYSVLTNLALVGSLAVPVATSDALGAILPRFRRRDERLRLLFVFGGIRTATLLVILASLLAGWNVVRSLIGLDAVSRDVFLVGAAYWLAFDVLNTLAGFFLANLQARPVAAWRSTGLAVALATLIALIASGRVSVVAVLATVAGGYAIGFAGLLLRLRPVQPASSIDPELMRGAWRSTFGIWLAVVLSAALGTQLDALLVAGVTGRPRQVAFFAGALGIVGRAQLLLLAGWSTSIIPALSEAFVRGGEAGLRRAWGLFAQIWLLAAVPMNAFLCVLGPALVQVVFGDSYRPVGGLLQWLAILNLAFAFGGGTLGGVALWVLDRQAVVVRVRAGTAVLHVGLAVVLIYWLAALGAVVASGVALAVTAIVELFFAHRIARIKLPIEFAVRVAIATSIAAAAAALVPGAAVVRLVAGACLAVVLLVAGLFVLRPFARNDLELLGRISPRLGGSPLRRLAR